MKYRKETRRRERDHYGVAVKENYRYHEGAKEEMRMTKHSSAPK